MITQRYGNAKKIKKEVALTTIVAEAEEEYNLERGTKKNDTIFKRYQRMKLGVQNSPGSYKSPLHDVEQTIVEFALQRSLVNRPFDKVELIAFTNSLIQ